MNKEEGVGDLARFLMIYRELDELDQQRKGLQTRLKEFSYHQSGLSQWVNSQPKQEVVSGNRKIFFRNYRRRETLTKYRLAKKLFRVLPRFIPTITRAEAGLIATEVWDSRDIVQDSVRLVSTKCKLKVIN